MKTSRAVCLPCVLIAAWACCATAQAAEPATDASSETVVAVYKEQQIRFVYQSFTTFYACQTLEDRITAILLALGADKSVQVRSSGCELGRLARAPSVRIAIRSPILATPEALAELQKSRSERELTARVRGQQQPDLDERFAAGWKRVSLFRGKLHLEPGDCPLVEQLQRYVFPKLGVRTVEERLNCSPNQGSLSQPRLELDALVPLTELPVREPQPAATP